MLELGKLEIHVAEGRTLEIRAGQVRSRKISADETHGLVSHVRGGAKMREVRSAHVVEAKARRYLGA